MCFMCICLALKQPLYDITELEEDKIYFAKKLGITLDEYYNIMKQPPKYYTDYPNSEKLIQKHKKLIKKLSKIKNKL